MNSESSVILGRITGILEDKRGVSVVDEVIGGHAWEFQFGSAPGPSASADLDAELAALLNLAGLTEGGKNYLRRRFITLVQMGIDTESTIAMSGVVEAVEAHDKKEFETEFFLAEARGIAHPEAHDISGLLKWGQDIEATYFKAGMNVEISSACNFLEHFVPKP